MLCCDRSIITCQRIQHARERQFYDGGRAHYFCDSCWFLGRCLLRYQVTIKDKDTGQKIKVPQPYHALFWIPMNWSASIFVVLGVWILIAYPNRQKSIASGSPAMATTDYHSATASATDIPHRVEGGRLNYSVLAPSDWTVARNKDDFDVELSTQDGTYAMGVYALAGAQGNTQRWEEGLIRKIANAPGCSLSRSQSVEIGGRTWRYTRRYVGCRRSESQQSHLCLCGKWGCICANGPFTTLSAGNRGIPVVPNCNILSISTGRSLGTSVDQSPVRRHFS